MRFAPRVLPLAMLPMLVACVTVADYRKLEHDVNKLKTQRPTSAPERERVADLVAEMEALRGEIARLEGRVEVAEHRAASAVEEARSAREAAYAASRAPGIPEPEGDAPPLGVSEELDAYRQAYEGWRSDDTQACIDRFREFLQTYPSSDYADDAAYWMADCYFKQGDYKTAILRFDDVAGRYPTSDKAPDALYRQAEALLRLGPNFGRAAERAFERVVNEYPDSPRAVEAKGQLELLGQG